MLEYSREALEKFIRVEAETSHGAAVHFYGGDQSWFESENGRAGGCGTIAAANILAYFGVVFSDDGEFGGDGPVPEGRVMSQAAYRAHMHQVYAGLTPLVPPWKSLGRFRAGRGDRTKRQRAILRLPDSLGIHSPVRFANAIVALAKGQCVTLRPVWPQGSRGGWPGLSLNQGQGQGQGQEQARVFIQRQIELGLPVAMLNFSNRGLRSVEYQSVVSGRMFTTDRFQWHWVVITGIERDARSGVEALIASSWGNRVTLELDRFWGRGMTHLVSFEMVEPV